MPLGWRRPSSSGFSTSSWASFADVASNFARPSARRLSGSYLGQIVRLIPGNWNRFGPARSFEGYYLTTGAASDGNFRGCAAL